MIFVRKNINLIPKKVLDAAEKAQAQLEALPEDHRAAFIEGHGRVWSAFKEYLTQMSGGKCWYSESKEVQSFLEVDHFRPKRKAKRSDTEIDPGYDWLAFEWTNFRLAAARSNKLSTNESTGEVEGKGIWFPLMEDSPKATWNNRCEEMEVVVLIDPTIQKDVDLIDIDANGRVIASRLCIGSQNRKRVSKSIEIYGLNLPKLVEARKSIMRDIQSHLEYITECIEEDMLDPNAERSNRSKVPEKVDFIRSKTTRDSAYAKAVRAHLRFQGWSDLCVNYENVI